jgi:large subunit ribosomal protein L10
MSDNLNRKIEQIRTLNGHALANAGAVFVLHCSGLKVPDQVRFRADLRALDVDVRVVKNTLAKRLFAETPFEPVNGYLTGPSMLLFVRENPQEVAKYLVGFLKKNKEVAVQCIALGDHDALSGSRLPEVVSMLTQEQARAMLLAVLKQPAQGLLRAIKHPLTSLGQVLERAVAEKPSS